MIFVILLPGVDLYKILEIWGFFFFFHLIDSSEKLHVSWPEWRKVRTARASNTSSRERTGCREDNLPLSLFFSLCSLGVLLREVPLHV